MYSRILLIVHRPVSWYNVKKQHRLWSLRIPLQILLNLKPCLPNALCNFIV